jgi:enterochelin esterase-like enzyme
VTGPWLSRRRLLLAGGGGVVALGGAAVVGGTLVRTGMVAGSDRIARAAGACEGSAPGDGGRPGPVVAGSFESEARGRRVGWSIAYPAGSGPGARLPVCLVLHGRGADHRTAFTALRLNGYLDPARPFALAAVDGGEIYWHPRAGGDDPLGMLTDELLPLLARRGLAVDRFGVYGWSMGGYGALLLGRELPGRVAAVAAASPALWTSFAATTPGSFDDEADWERWGRLDRVDRLAGVPVRIDCGTGDPFVHAVRALTRRLPGDAQVEIASGCHDDTFWRRRAPAQLQVIARALTP